MENLGFEKMQQWIKIEKQCHEKPEIGQMMEFLGAGRAEVFLACFRFWDWLDSHFAEGQLTANDLVQVDQIVELPGFVEAQIACGWIVPLDDVYLIKNFNRHNGRNAKRRAQAQRRVAQWRERQDENE